MKLLTTLAPRKDGTVLVRSDDGKKLYTFAPEKEGGDLVGEVDDEALLVRLLKSNNFEPADESQFDAAEALLVASGGSDSDPGEDPEDDDPIDPNAPPIEGKTPPADPAKAAKKKK